VALADPDQVIPYLFPPGSAFDPTFGEHARRHHALKCVLRVSVVAMAFRIIRWSSSSNNRTRNLIASLQLMSHILTCRYIKTPWISLTGSQRLTQHRTLKRDEYDTNSKLQR